MLVAVTGVGLSGCASGGGGEAETEIATDAPSAPLPGTYTGELPAADSPGRTITLRLSPEGAAEMATDYRNGQPTVVQRGKWSPVAADRARVAFTEIDGRPAAETLTFQLRGTTLTAVQFDRTSYGSAGLTLERQ